MTRIIVKQYLTSKTELMNQKVKRYNYSRNYELIWIDWWFIIPTIWWFIIATTHYVMWEKCPVCHKFTTQALEVVRKHSPAIYFYDVMWGMVNRIVFHPQHTIYLHIVIWGMVFLLVYFLVWPTKRDFETTQGNDGFWKKDFHQRYTDQTAVWAWKVLHNLRLVTHQNSSCSSNMTPSGSLG